jgi:hypothetical protein
MSSRAPVYAQKTSRNVRKFSLSLVFQALTLGLTSDYALIWCQKRQDFAVWRVILRVWRLLVFFAFVRAHGNTAAAP